jgi:2,5-diketo-D-gluconate reductase B
VSPLHLKYANVLTSCENSLRRLNMDYIDLYLIHWPTPVMNLADTFKALNQLVREGKVRHLGVSNFNLKQLQQAASHSETPLLVDQVPYSVPDQKYVKNGVLEYCQQHGTLVTAYTPVNHRYTAGNKDLKAAALARGISAYQLSIAWLASQPGVITIPRSLDPQHQRDNLAAADIVLTPEEIEALRRKY